MSEQELEVTETGLEESPDVTAEAGEESEVESSAPESDDAASDDGNHVHHHNGGDHHGDGAAAVADDDDRPLGRRGPGRAAGTG